MFFLVLFFICCRSAVPLNPSSYASAAAANVTSTSALIDLQCSAARPPVIGFIKRVYTSTSVHHHPSSGCGQRGRNSHLGDTHPQGQREHGPLPCLSSTCLTWLRSDPGGGSDWCRAASRSSADPISHRPVGSAARHLDTEQPLCLK